MDDISGSIEGTGLVFAELQDMRSLFFQLCMVSLLLFSGKVYAEEHIPHYLLEPEEELFIHLMHQARSDPVSAAQDLGLDLQDLFQKRPEMKFLLQQELPALEFSPKLFRAASGHSQDMLNDGYYSHQRPDGSGPEARMSEQGYDPFVWTEELGLVGFRNFIGPEQATSALFSQVFIDELRSKDASDLIILNPYFRHAGAGIAKGFLSLESFAGNAYISTLNLASETDVLFELMLRRRINDARLAPESVEALVQAYPSDAFDAQDAADPAHMLKKQSPVSMSGELTGMARFLGRKMLQEHGLDGFRTGFPYDAEGFEPNIPSGSAHKFLLLPVDPETSIEALADMAFWDLFHAELDALEDMEPFIFNSQFSKSGIGVFDIEYAQERYLFVVVLLSGQADDPEYLMGRIRFLPGMEKDLLHARGMRIHLSTVDEYCLKGFAVSGPGGFYQMKTPDAQHPFTIYELKLENASGKILERKRIYLHRGNQRHDFNLEYNQEDL